MEKLIQDVQHLASEITDGEKKFRKAPSVVTALEIVSTTSSKCSWEACHILVMEHMEKCLYKLMGIFLPIRAQPCLDNWKKLFPYFGVLHAVKLLSPSQEVCVDAKKHPTVVQVCLPGNVLETAIGIQKHFRPSITCILFRNCFHLKPFIFTFDVSCEYQWKSPKTTSVNLHQDTPGCCHACCHTLHIFIWATQFSKEKCIEGVDMFPPLHYHTQIEVDDLLKMCDERACHKLTSSFSHFPSHTRRSVSAVKEILNLVTTTWWGLWFRSCCKNDMTLFRCYSDITKFDTSVGVDFGGEVGGSGKTNLDIVV
ncbi:hypothetical protein KUF71_003413 [Frankliniella fusca]|uniref:Uncharacterized protein n=1 Tax=Frankliniella fusca TaxID=407009 RepID=A0AAE1GSZ3_9NEOP|nr:hypothetical protein KUF71_003413 [Frankliniella fusca]